jgi:hypothetical protein
MCDAGALTQVMSLAPTPPGNALLRPVDRGRPILTYPLDLYFCADCHHVQLGHVVDPRILYQKNYLYVSGTSAPFVNHLRTYAEDMVGRFRLEAGGLVADIGSNDGTCLGFFRDRGMRVLGVDPAEGIAAAASRAGIETVTAFFSLETARELRESHGPAQFVTSHNALAHIDGLDDVVRGVEHWLADDGTFVLEVGYFVDVFQKLYFDTIYHEHLDYHTVAPFRQLFARTGMEMFAVQRVSPQGGSIRVMARKRGRSQPHDDSVDALIQLERSLGLDRPETLRSFGARIDVLGERLRALLSAIKAEGRTIAAYGAPTKAVTLLSQFRIGSEYIDFVVEDNAMKHGLILPVAGIPVLPTEELYRAKPDYALILAWNFAESIMAAHRRFKEEGGRFIIPLPEPRIA